MSFESEPDTEEEPLLRFVLEGVYYSLRQNKMSREVAEAELKRWFPDVLLVEHPPKGYRAE